jgi:hypothetical protein
MAGEEYDSIVEYLTNGFALFEELNRNAFTGDPDIAELITVRCQEFVCGLSLLYRSLRWPEEIKRGFEAVIALFQERISRILERFDLSDNENCRYSCPINENARRYAGRPRFLITKEQLEGLRSIHFSWRKIAEMLGVSERTVRRRRQELEMTIGQSLSYSEIEDGELDIFVGQVLHYSPHSGERMVFGALKGYGLKVQRERVRQSIGRVDPVSRELRRRTAIHRRVYNVIAPNVLW